MEYTVKYDFKYTKYTSNTLPEMLYCRAYTLKTVFFYRILFI